MVPTRTPMPTATPDALAEGILQIVQETGMSEKTLFWLGYSEWINLGISLFFVLAGYLIGTWLIRWLLPRLVRRTKTNLDDLLLRVAANELRWLAVVLIFRFSINRLNFIHASVKALIADVSFFLAIFLIAELLWRLISLAANQADERTQNIDHQAEAESLITLATWTLRLIVLIFVAALTLSYFGVNITGFAFILGIIVLAFSLAGRDILTDIISGAMILIDSPFRIGDRLELPSIDSWGDVVEIGMRSTKILSMENRMVVLPNSLIGKNQIINYSYPDPSYFNLVKVVVAYDNDPDQVSEILEAAIRSVEGVQKEREVVA
jgi:small-conductance mechanosensitive channel